MPATDLTDNLAIDVQKMMEEAWTQPGYCVPNQTVYPHQWLWDSCFHSVIWSRYNDPRAVTELVNVFAHQDPATGFVPHMTYWTDPTAAADFWGRTHTSNITQPPMYGHAAAVLTRAGQRLPSSTHDNILAGFRHLLNDRTRTPAGLIPIYHPWENGCDDSLRWDGFSCPNGAAFNATRWREIKHRLVTTVKTAQTAQTDRTGTPVANPEFTIGSISFNALAVFNVEEYSSVYPCPPELSESAEQLKLTISKRWDPTVATWADDDLADGAASKARTADTLLALLVDPREEAFRQLTDSEAFGSPFGPTGVHRQEPNYDPNRYWRGTSWPQINYLLAVAAQRQGKSGLATSTMHQLRDAAASTGLTEHWNPETGRPHGATPQTWTGLAVVDPLTT